MLTGTRMVREVRRLLKASGREFSIENGGRHMLVMIEGRQVRVLPKGRQRDVLGKSHLRAIEIELKRLRDRTSERMP